ncbi:MAG: ABC transporter ATP-binding protein [Anaerolineae bacterium]
MTPLLQVNNVTKVFASGILRKRATVALDGFSLSLPTEPARVITIAGESGSGKTTLARLVLGFITPTAGQILYKGQDIHRMARGEWVAYRREVQAVFQDPYEVYNPFYKVDHVLTIVIEKFRLARNRKEAQDLIEQSLEVVGLQPREILGKYPHQLSGGQRQRVMMARAFLLKPRLIVADEPVSMLDASLRAMVLEIMMKLKREFGISFLYITHDLSTAYQISDDLVILYQGSIAEQGNAAALIKSPQHPYTRLLVNSIPVPSPRRKWQDRVELPPEQERGVVRGHGCKFADRCPHVMSRCRESRPSLIPLAESQYAACFLYATGD